MVVYTIAGGKGGVGKSATTASLGIALYDAGFDVALVDADLAMANLAALLDVDYDSGIHSVLAERASVEDVLVEVSDGFYLVPGDQPLDLFGEAEPANLGTVVRSLADAVDVVLVDTGAGLGHEVLVATGVADGTLLVTTPDDEAVADVARTAELVDHVDAAVLGAVVTRTNPDTEVGVVADDLGVPVLGAVPEDPSVGTDPATTGPAGTAYRQLAATLLASHRDGQDADRVPAPASVDWSPVDVVDEECDSADASSGLSDLLSFGD